MYKSLFYMAVAFTFFALTVSADTIYEEDFESGAIPAGWQVWQEGPSSEATWVFDQTSYPYEGTYYCYHGYDYANDLDDWCVTQTFDMSNCENLQITFWHSGSFASDYGYTGFMGSNVETPDAADFSEIVEIGAPPATSTELGIDISAYDFSEFVTFAWRYTGLDGHTVRLDNVLIEGDVITGIESASLGEIKAVFK